jgi:hypothetical protein
MRVATRSAVVVLAAASAAMGQGQPPGPPRPTDLLPSGLQMPADIIPPGPKPQTRAGRPADWMAAWDDLWKRRDDPAVLHELEEMIEEHLAGDPDGFETTRRKASLVAWEADGEPDGSEAKAAKGKIAWESGDKAIQANASDVRGHYYSGVGVGLYSEGVGILTALSQGLEGKFRERMLAALRIDKDFQDGAPQVVWGRYFFKLPWPKRDLDESIKVLRAAVRSHPNNWRAKLYLADSLIVNGLEGQDDEAHALVQQILDAPGGRDPPEEKRVKEMARRWKSKH